MEPVYEMLRDRFGFSELRAGQEPVIRALLEGRSALAVFPTGGGKSLCYQLPALMLEGVALVVSPLIALMKDQVDALRSKGIAAARWDSTLSGEELQDLGRRLDAGEVRLLYVAPERFANEGFRKRLRKMTVSLVAVDEAHCISEWGHNFRPDYLKLATLFRRLKIRRVLALTATATPKVAREIRRAFRIRAEDQVQLSFHRPNLDLRVTPCREEEKKDILLDRLKTIEGAAVVYVTRQETTEEVGTFLRKAGVLARAYHAGLPAEVRAEAQQEFMEGKVRVMVATIAFGMGIDKPDIRAVYHYHLSKSLENYTQEIGRGGRDGLPAWCELLACAEDRITLENFIHADTPTPRALVQLLDRVLRLGEVFSVSPYDLSMVCDLRSTVVETVMMYLELEGWIEATGSHYATYRVKWVRTLAQVLAGRPVRERAFLQRLFEAGQEGRGVVKFEPDELAESLGVPRSKIVAALLELEAAGECRLEVSGVRQDYVLKREPEDRSALAAEMVKRFEERAASDLKRISEVLGLSAQRGCLTAVLTRHFGEKLAEPCGHCDRCRGVKPTALKLKRPRRVSPQELVRIRQVVDERHPALGAARQLARFLCGMSSPASTRARLSRREEFGMLADLPFEEVLALTRAFVEGVS